MYTIEDVIIDRDLDLSGKKGCKCYVGRNPYECLTFANENLHEHAFKKIKNDSNFPFRIDSEKYSATNGYPCIIFKKEN